MEFKQAYAILIVGVVCLSGTLCQVQFRLSRDKLAWPDAATACAGVDGRLAILDNLELQTLFNTQMTSAVGEPVWVGRYVAYSSIVSVDGCYRNQSLGNRITRNIVDNHLVTCLKECQNSSFIGMQGQLCFCLDAVPSTAGAAVPGGNCRTTCPGEPPSATATVMSQCGNPNPQINTVSVYRRVDPKEIRLDRNQPNQGECVAFNSMTDNWVTRDCNIPSPFACLSTQCQGQFPMCALESSNPNTWFGARTLCETYGYLATVNLTTSAIFKDNVVLNDPHFWTGMFRKEAIVWDYDENPRHLERSDRCFAVARRPDGAWDWMLDYCKRPLRFACVQDTKTTTTTQPPATTVTMPPRPTAPPVITTTTRPTTTPRLPVTQTTTTEAQKTWPTVDPNALPINVNGGRSSMGLGFLTYICMNLGVILGTALFII
ncbi:hypothetical protein DPMN_128051 [Dreissena polymorpha]|uniref:WSC domain-containing protein n=1 Tax=Dreissena polymorpha TaxID=45954 RepID=A0A9D4H2A6_DREPO|nr:hypothetical protein DPMN_128051 [Dreissena polymorpha]